MMVEDNSENSKNSNGVYNISQEQIKGKEQKPADFEEAITATEFGKFNIFLMLVVVPPSFAQVFETVAISYVLPVAQCDLNLTLEDKGVLNAVTFAGMISSGFFWGYLCDTLGRKKIMIYGYLLNAFFMLMGSFSPNTTVLMVAKFFGGFILNGPFAATTSYLYEFHSSRYRARVQMISGMILSLANVILPLLAWGVLPREFHYVLFNYFNFHSWNAFLLICALAPILSGILFMFMPESPKFLMSAGRNDAALQVFRKVYKINTGKPLETYPIEHLLEETINVTKKSTKQALREGLHQMKPLFCPPYVLKLLLVCANAHLLMMGMNTLKLWLPQLFQAINDYQHFHDGASSNLCEMLEDLTPKNVSQVCSVNLENSSVYINSITVGTARMVAFGFGGSLVNLLGKKKLLIILAIITGSFSSSIYFAQNSETVSALSAVDVAIGSVCDSILISITLELFPTTLRTLALSLHMLFGRVGTIVGNVVFPFLLLSGCLPPFVFIGSLAFGCACLSFLYPETENKALL